MPTEQHTNSQDLRVELVVGAPPEQAFAVFTERIDEWWPRSYRLGQLERTGLRLEPHVGGHWYEVSRDDSTTPWGNVLAWKPPAHVALGWQITPGFAPESNPERASRVDVHFVADGAGQTRVTLVHSGFERHGDGWESARGRRWRRRVARHPHGVRPGCRPVIDLAHASTAGLTLVSASSPVELREHVDLWWHREGSHRRNPRVPTHRSRGTGIARAALKRSEWLRSVVCRRPPGPGRATW